MAISPRGGVVLKIEIGGHLKCMAIKLNQSLGNTNNASKSGGKSGQNVPSTSLPHYTAEYISQVRCSAVNL